MFPTYKEASNNLS